MCLRASDPAGHHGWGGRWMRCGRRPGFRGDPPYLVRQAQVPFPLECIPPALSPRLPDCGSSTSAGMPSAASRMGVESLSQKSKTITTFGLWVPLKTELCCLPATFRKWTLS